MKKTPLRRKSKSPLRKEKDKLWTLVKKYIRARDGNYCITCGTFCEGTNAHCGHFIPDAAGGNALRYHPMNINRQCMRCNVHLGGWGEKYADEMEKLHGRKVVDKLRKLRLITCKLDYEKAIQYYQDKIDNQDFTESPTIPDFCERL